MITYKVTGSCLFLDNESLEIFEASSCILIPVMKIMLAKNGYVKG